MTARPRARAALVSLAAATAGVAAPAACGGASPTVPTTELPGYSAGRPRRPPPTQRVECVPPRPADERCRWQAGHSWWDPATQRWEWTDGAWVVPPAGCRRTLPALWYQCEDRAGPRGSRSEPAEPSAGDGGAEEVPRAAPTGCALHADGPSTGTRRGVGVLYHAAPVWVTESGARCPVAPLPCEPGPGERPCPR